MRMVLPNVITLANVLNAKINSIIIGHIGCENEARRQNGVILFHVFGHAVLWDAIAHAG